MLTPDRRSQRSAPRSLTRPQGSSTPSLVRPKSSMALPSFQAMDGRPRTMSERVYPRQNAKNFHGEHIGALRSPILSHCLKELRVLLHSGDADRFFTAVRECVGSGIGSLRDSDDQESLLRELGRDILRVRGQASELRQKLAARCEKGEREKYDSSLRYEGILQSLQSSLTTLRKEHEIVASQNEELEHQILRNSHALREMKRMLNMKDEELREALIAKEKQEKHNREEIDKRDALIEELRRENSEMDVLREAHNRLELIVEQERKAIQAQLDHFSDDVIVKDRIQRRITETITGDKERMERDLWEKTKEIESLKAHMHKLQEEMLIEKSDQERKEEELRNCMMMVRELETINERSLAERHTLMARCTYLEKQIQERGNKVENF